MLVTEFFSGTLAREGGTGKLRSFWEKDVAVISQVRDPDGLLYAVRRESEPTGKVRILHRNLLLPCEFLSGENQTVKKIGDPDKGSVGSGDILNRNDKPQRSSERPTSRKRLVTHERQYYHSRNENADAVDTNGESDGFAGVSLEHLNVLSNRFLTGEQQNHPEAPADQRNEQGDHGGSAVDNPAPVQTNCDSEFVPAHTETVVPPPVTEPSQVEGRHPSRLRRPPLYLTYDSDFNEVCGVSG